MELVIKIPLDGNNLEESDFHVFHRESRRAVGINLEVSRSVPERESEIARVFGISAEYFTVELKHEDAPHAKRNPLAGLSAEELLLRVSTEATTDNVGEGWTEIRRRLQRLEKCEPICKQIKSIMETYREQAASFYGVDTPGGLEHMGDVWRLFAEWDAALGKERGNG